MILKNTSNSAEARQDKNFIILTEKIDSLQNKIAEQQEIIQKLESKIMDKLDICMSKEKVKYNWNCDIQLNHDDEMYAQNLLLLNIVFITLF